MNNSRCLIFRSFWIRSIGHTSIITSFLSFNVSNCQNLSFFKPLNSVIVLYVGIILFPFVSQLCLKRRVSLGLATQVNTSSFLYFFVFWTNRNYCPLWKPIVKCNNEVIRYKGWKNSRGTPAMGFKRLELNLGFYGMKHIRILLLWPFQKGC